MEPKDFKQGTFYVTRHGSVMVVTDNEKMSNAIEMDGAFGKKWIVPRDIEREATPEEASACRQQMEHMRRK